MKKKIAFLAPKNKWGTYYYYEGISEYLDKNYSDLYDVYFFSGYFNYFKLHFQKFDTIFSIVPFFWKPLWAKKYIFNLHWNYKQEGNIFSILKTFKIYDLNLWFSDNIMLVSYYLSDTIGFSEKYKNKIEIVGNYVNKIWDTSQKHTKQFNFLTVTSSAFYEKARWIIDLVEVLKSVCEIKINEKISFTIVWIQDKNILAKLQWEIAKMNLSNDISLIWKPWLNKEELEEEYKNNDYFLYWTYLDNFPWVILDAIANWMTCYTNDYESFSYFLDEQYICKTREDMMQKILLWKQQDNSFISEYNIENITKKLLKII